MQNSKRVRVLAGVFGSLTAVLVTLVTFQSITASVSDMEGLIGISITPRDAVLVPGASIRLTAEGDYGSMTMPVKADWALVEGEDLGELGRCTNTKACTFSAGDAPGIAIVQAQVGDGDLFDQVEIMIEESLENPFTDELPDWALEAVVRLNQLGVIHGYDDGSYGPGDPVTNGQVITLLHRMLVLAGLIEEGGGCRAYDDVPADHYAYVPACTFKNQEWSTEDSHLSPDEAASRGDVAGYVNRSIGETLMEALSERPEAVQYFEDVPLDHPFYADTAVTNVTGIMTGYPNGDFGVGDDFNRAAAAIVIYRILMVIDEQGIDELIGYDPDADDGHGSAPQTRASCIVLADNVTSPRADDPDMADGYVMHGVSDPHDLNSIRAYCTDQIFEELTEQYCAQESNAGRRFQRGVLLYNDDGSIRMGGGPAGGTEYYECASAEEPVRAACSVQADNIGSPTAGDPEEGDGYVKRNVHEQHTIPSIRSYCTMDLYEALMDRYCAVPENHDRRVQWGVLLYGEDGEILSGGGPGVGQGYHMCPESGAYRDLRRARSGACVITGEGSGGSAARDAADVGTGYAKRNIPEDLDIYGFRNRCSDSVYEELMESYCVFGDNRDRRAQWGVLMYNEHGGVHTGGGAASGSNYHECPSRG